VILAATSTARQPAASVMMSGHIAAPRYSAVAT